MHHSFIIRGSYGIGKATLAIAIIKKLISLQIKDEKSSNKDINLIEKLSHPDLLYVSNLDGKNAISVDQVRSISMFLSVPSSRLKNKFIIIDAIDYLNDYAANALLKNLEEAPSDCFFLLISHKQSVIETINSRCIIYNLPDLTAEENALFLENKQIENKEEIKNIINTFNISFGLSLKMFDSGFYEIYKVLLAKISGNNYDFDWKDLKIDNKLWLKILVNRVIKVICQSQSGKLNSDEENLLKSIKIDKKKITKLFNKQTEWGDLIIDGDVYNANFNDLFLAICADIYNILN